MKIGLAILMLVCVCAVAPCATRGNFYLVQGPLSSQTPIAFSADLKGDPYPRNLSAMLASGEGFQGRWKSGAAGKIRMQDAPVVPPQPELTAAWDAIYGQGFFVAQILGAKNFARTVLTGSKGTILQVEIHWRVSEDSRYPRNAGLLDIQGVAQDDKGNVYKVVF